MADQHTADPRWSVGRAERQARARALTFGDQALSSLTNFAGSALAAGLLTATDFGAFSVATSVLVLILGVCRSCVGNVLMIRGPGVDEHTFREMWSGAVTLSAVLGLLTAAIAGATGPFLTRPLQIAMYSLAVTVPLVTMQDALRLGYLARRDPLVAFRSDGAWLIATIIGLMVLRRTDTRSIALSVLAANATAVLGLAVALRAARLRLSLRSARTWAIESRTIAAKMLGDFLIALSYGAVPLVAATAWRADLAQAGSVRTAAVVFGPLTVVYAASTLYMQPRMATASTPREVHSMALSQSFWNSAFAVAWVAIALSIPDRLAVRVFGESWVDSSSALWSLGIAFVAMAVPTGPLTALRARNRLTANLITQALIAASVVTSTALVGVASTRGMLHGFAIGHCMSVLIAWVALTRSVRGMRSPIGRTGIS